MVARFYADAPVPRVRIRLRCPRDLNWNNELLRLQEELDKATQAAASGLQSVQESVRLKLASVCPPACRAAQHTRRLTCSIISVSVSISKPCARRPERRTLLVSVELAAAAHLRLATPSSACVRF